MRFLLALLVGLGALGLLGAPPRATHEGQERVCAPGGDAAVLGDASRAPRPHARPGTTAQLAALVARHELAAPPAAAARSEKGAPSHARVHARRSTEPRSSRGPPSSLG